MMDVKRKASAILITETAAMTVERETCDALGGPGRGCDVRIIRGLRHRHS